MTCSSDSTGTNSASDLVVARWARTPNEPSPKPPADDSSTSDSPTPRLPSDRLPSDRFAAAPGRGDDGSSLPAQSSWLDDPRLPACLVSTIIHTVLLLVLALWTLAPSGRRESMLEVRLGPATESVALSRGGLVATFSIESDATESSEMQQPTPVPIAAVGTVLPSASSLRPESRTSTTKSSPESIEPLERMESESPHATGLVRLPSSAGLEGRSPSQRARLGQQYGATRESEEAVELALEWLAEHQQRSGAWSFDLSQAPCDGRCRHNRDAEGTPTPNTGATGLALLAFLGAGYTHEEGKYAETVKRGLYYLRNVGSPTQAGIDWQQGSMYGHGIALMAVAEAVAMEQRDSDQESEFLVLLQQATNFTCAAQHSNGSWGYIPGSPGDTTLTGWQVLSLVGARRSNVPIFTLTMPRAKSFLFSVSEGQSYQFGYKTPEPEPTTTAIGLTLLLYLGETPGSTLYFNSLTEMARRGPTLTNVYHDYYATLALHHTRHPLWDGWNRKLRDHLVRTQVQEGHERGSWHFKDRWGDVGGRLYTTAMAAMILEVYYRYLPMYGPIEDFPL